MRDCFSFKRWSFVSRKGVSDEEYAEARTFSVEACSGAALRTSSVSHELSRRVSKIVN